MNEIATIYTSFQQVLLRYIRSKVRSREDAEDILQNVFIKVSAKLPSLSAKEKLKDWIFIITRNAIYDYYRQQDRRNNTTISDDELEVIPEEENSDPGHGLDQCLLSFIEALPENYRQVIRESELQGVRQKELAEKLGIPYSSLRSRVQRGRERLKQMLNDCCRIELDRRGNILEVNVGDSCENSCKSCGE